MKPAWGHMGEGADKLGARSALIVALVLAFGLPGCPLSDSYSTEGPLPSETLGSGGFGEGDGGSAGAPVADAGGTGGVANGGVAGTGGAGGNAVSATGGARGSGEATGGTDNGASGGTGGILGSGGSEVAPGSGGTDGTGGDACQPADEVCNGLDDDCDDLPDNDACPADCSGFVIDEHGYMYCGQATANADVEALCAAQGMLPVRVDSAEENQALVEVTQPLDSELGQPLGELRAIWIGAHDTGTEGTWTWSIGGDVFWIGQGNGTPVDGAYSNWGAGRPNDSDGEDCAVIYLQTGDDGVVSEWNDRACSLEFPFVCETP